MAKTNNSLEQIKVQQRRELITIGLITVAVLTAGASFYHLVEGMSFVDAIYFSVITLTTVGYGDLVPQTDAGKIFTAGYVLIGIGIIATFARVLLQSTFARRFRHDNESK